MQAVCHCSLLFAPLDYCDGSFTLTIVPATDRGESLDLRGNV